MEKKYIEIEMSFENYKLHKDKNIKLSNSWIYLIVGPNDSAKTTTKNSLLSALILKELSDEPITRGETEGKRSITIPTKDGKVYTIYSEYKENKVKWYAIDEEGNIINKITQIRNLFNYHNITAEEFIGMSKTADGRKKQLKTLLDLLPEDYQKQYEYLQAQENNKYSERTGLSNKISATIEALSKIIISTEEKEKYSQKDVAVSTLKKLRDDKEDYLMNNPKKKLESEISSLRSDYDKNKTIYETEVRNLDKDIVDIENEIARLTEKLKSKKDDIASLHKMYEPKLKNISNSISEKENSYKGLKDSFNLEEVNNRITKGEDFIKSLNDIETKIKNKELLEASLKKERESEKILTDSIEGYREKKKELIQKSNLKDFNISFKDDYLYVNDFKFDENSLCTSAAYKLVAKLLISLNKNVPIIVMGNSSELDYNSLNEIYKMAEENGYAMIFDEVDRNADELKIVCYEPK